MVGGQMDRLLEIAELRRWDVVVTLQAPNNNPWGDSLLLGETTNSSSAEVGRLHEGLWGA